MCMLSGPSYMLKNGKKCVSFFSRPTESLSVLAGTRPCQQFLNRGRGMAQPSLGTTFNYPPDYNHRLTRTYQRGKYEFVTSFPILWVRKLSQGVSITSSGRDRLTCSNAGIEIEIWFMYHFRPKSYHLCQRERERASQALYDCPSAAKSSPASAGG